MAKGEARLLRGYKTALKAVGLRAYLEIEISALSFCSKELKVGRKELKRHTVRSEITSLKAKSSHLIDLIGHVLCELYSKHTLYLLNRRIALDIHIAGDNLLYLILACYSSPISNGIANTSMN